MEHPINRSLPKAAGQMTRQTAHFRGQIKPVAEPALHLAPLPKLAHVGPQLLAAVGLTGLYNTGLRMLVIDVERNKLIHREPPGQIRHGLLKRSRMLPAPRRLRFHGSADSTLLPLYKKYLTWRARFTSL